MAKAKPQNVGDTKPSSQDAEFINVSVLLLLHRDYKIKRIDLKNFIMIPNFPVNYILAIIF